MGANTVQCHKIAEHSYKRLMRQAKVATAAGGRQALWIKNTG